MAMELENVTINTQSSVRIAGMKTLYFDPLEINGSPHDADIIFISHEHYDHFSPKDIGKVAGSCTEIVFPKSMENKISETGIPTERRHSMEQAETMVVQEVPVEAVAAYNKLKPFHPKRNAWLGYIVQMDGIRYYFAGDTDATEEAKAVRCDVAFLPIGGTYTTNAKEAAGLANAIQPSVAVPMHYGSIVGKPQDADIFRKNVDKNIRVILKLAF
ncbi:MAG: MBL fold metallo-hydrolase [Lachnospiraceae bacterium]|nr:MBL fold metallo-hydrolase [Lachnospiraceae bacterium]